MLVHTKEGQVRHYKEVAMDHVSHTRYCLVFAQLPFLNKQKALIQGSTKDKRKKKKECDNKNLLNQEISAFEV